MSWGKHLIPLPVCFLLGAWPSLDRDCVCVCARAHTVNTQPSGFLCMY